MGGISAASEPLTKGSLNSAVLGRYTFSMISGVVVGFLKDWDLLNTEWWLQVDITSPAMPTGVPIKAGPVVVEKSTGGAIVFQENTASLDSASPSSSMTACLAAAQAAEDGAVGQHMGGSICGNAALTFYTDSYPKVGSSKPSTCFCNPTGSIGM